jgi:hypothetical protein
MTAARTHANVRRVFARAGVSRFVLRPLILALLLLTAGCSLFPPPGGINHVEGGGGTHAAMAEFGVQPLDPHAAVPLTKQALEEVEKTDPLRLLRGTTYGLSSGNALPHGWIMETPDVWGKRAAAVRVQPLDCKNCDADFRLPVCRAPPACRTGRCGELLASVAKAGDRPRRFCLGPADKLIDSFYTLVISAHQSVDIAMLAPPADGRFLAALRNAVTWLAHSGRAVTIRAIAGDYPPEGVDMRKFLDALVRDARDVPGSQLRVYAGATRSCNAGPGCNGLSWNHAKIVAVDGERAIVGGENLWSPDYLAEDPVFDISMKLEGPAAGDANRFADALWDEVCDHKPAAGVNEHFAFFGAAASDRDACVDDMPLAADAATAAPGDVQILAMGRLAQGVTRRFADQSLIARDLLLGAATSSIRMVQQDVAFALAKGAIDVSWPVAVLDDIADLLSRKNGEVWIVLSNVGATGPIGTYSNGVPLDASAQKIKDIVAKRSGLKDPALSDLLCHRLHLAPLRFGPDVAWTDGRPIATHAKFWMVDDRLFYVGSENLYPADLQEFGYAVDNAKAAAEIKKTYWDKAWKWSRRAAISGDGAPSCVFTAKAPPQAAVERGRE